jgi:hypothetical protein
MTAQVILRFLEHVHGHMGWLSVAALLHPAIILRNPRRRARLAVSLATAFVTVAGSLGVSIYPEYRSLLKPSIFVEAPTVGWLFERKEHLAVGALGFAWIGCLAHLTARSFDDEGLRSRVSVIAHRSYVIAFALSLAAACLGVIVAVHRTF